MALCEKNVADYCQNKNYCVPLYLLSVKDINTQTFDNYMDIKENISLKAYNTFGIDAKASMFVEYDTEKGLQQLLESGLLQSNPFLILGGGSNIVFANDYRGVIVHPVNKGIISEKECHEAYAGQMQGGDNPNMDSNHVFVEVAAGEVWSDFAWAMTRKGYYGLENLVEIPGNVGAAPVQNVGAYGVEAKDVIAYVVAYEIETGIKRVFTNKECKFGYRDSIFKNELKNKYIVFSVCFMLSKTANSKTNYSALSKMLSEKGIATPTPLQIAECIAEIRGKKLPDPKEVGSAGSFFKNPMVTYSELEAIQQHYPDVVSYPIGDKYKLAAGWLIEKCGWKGRTLGNAGVYPKQALVLFNNGGCTGNEVVALATAIEADVESRFGVRLEKEAIIIN